MNDADIKTADLKAKRYELWDDQVKGLFLQNTPKGDKVFHLRFRFGGRYRKGKIGVYRTTAAKKTQMTLAQARSTANDKLFSVAGGVDPWAEAKKKVAQEEADERVKTSRKTFAELADGYIELYAKRNKKSWDKDQSMLERDFLPRIGSYPLEKIKRVDAADVTRPIVRRGSPSAAKLTYEVMRAIFNWGVSEGYGGIEYSPMAGMN